MNLINRGVVVIKPKEPFLDWVNRNPDFSPPVTLEEVQQDCTVLLVPDLGGPEAVLDNVASLKPGLLEIELESWNRDPTTWPAERTKAQFDAWFTLEVHSMVWDTVADAIVKEKFGEAINVAGTWKVISSPDFDNDYLYEETVPTVTLHQSGTTISGDFHIGLIVGSLDGRWEGDRALFSFEATDEMDPVSGAGTMTLHGDRLIFSLLFHYGDEFTFECLQDD